MDKAFNLEYLKKVNKVDYPKISKSYKLVMRRHFYLVKPAPFNQKMAMDFMNLLI